MEPVISSNLSAFCYTYRAIMGFIRKSDAEEMLTRYATGTFLLRFSDSELGGLTVAWAGCE